MHRTLPDFTKMARHLDLARRLSHKDAENPLRFRLDPEWISEEARLLDAMKQAEVAALKQIDFLRELATAGSEQALLLMKGHHYGAELSPRVWTEIVTFADAPYIDLLKQASVRLSSHAFSAVVVGLADRPCLESLLGHFANQPQVVTKLLRIPDLRTLRKTRPDIIERALYALKDGNPGRDWGEDLLGPLAYQDEWAFAVLWMLVQPDEPFQQDDHKNAFIHRIGGMTSMHDRMALAAELGSVRHLLSQAHVAPSDPSFIRADAVPAS